MPGSAFGTSRKGPRFLLRDLIANRVFLERDTATNVVVSAANIIYNYDYAELIRAHNESGADITLLTKTYRCEAEDVSSVYTEDGHVRGFTYGTRFGDEGFLDCFVVRREKLLELIDRYRAERCYYGHLHGPTHRRAFEGRRGETDYALVSADYLGFVPKKICD